MDVADNNGSGTGLTLKQLVVEIREDVRSLTKTIEAKVDRTEFLVLKDKVERAMSGEATGAYAVSMMNEYRDLQNTVKGLSESQKLAKQAADIAKEAADKAKASAAKQESNRKWIAGLVVSVVIEGAALVAGFLRVHP